MQHATHTHAKKDVGWVFAFFELIVQHVLLYSDYVILIRVKISPLKKNIQLTYRCYLELCFFLSPRVLVHINKQDSWAR